MNEEKKEVLDNLIAVIKSIKNKKVNKFLMDIKEEMNVNKKSLSERILVQGDIITLKPVEFESDLGMFYGEVYKGEVAMSYEVWKVLAINGLHVRLKKMTNYIDEIPDEVIILKDNYEFAFAEDFLGG